MPSKAQLEAAVVKAKSNWRKVCANRASTADDRHVAFAAKKKAEMALNKALLLLKGPLGERRRAVSDRRKAAANAEWLAANTDRRKLVRRP